MIVYQKNKNKVACSFLCYNKNGDYMKTMLVLEGGALRGIYTAGVLDAFLDNNIKVDAIVGVSAGALFGINYVSKQRGRCIRYNLKNVKNKNYMGFYSFLTTGNIMNKKFCFDTLVHEQDPFDYETYKKSKTKFYCVVTNVETGKAEYKEVKDAEEDSEYLRASGSMPIVSQIVEIDGKKYLDGAIGDSVPVEWAIKQGYEKVIVVETRPKDFRRKKATLWPYKMIYKKYPNFVKAVENRTKEYNKTKKFIINEDRKKIFVIRPSKLVKIKRIEKDKEKIQEMYNLGLEDANNALKDLKKYLKG